jgi:hypothetical protein
MEGREGMENLQVTATQNTIEIATGINDRVSDSPWQTVKEKIRERPWLTSVEPFGSAFWCQLTECLGEVWVYKDLARLWSRSSWAEHTMGLLALDEVFGPLGCGDWSERESILR